MDYQAIETVIMNDEEFLLMLAAAGMDQWYGVQAGTDDTSPMTNEEFNRREASLYRGNFIDWIGDKARISDEFKHMFSILSGAKYCIRSARGDRLLALTAQYCLDGDVAVVERNFNGTDEVKITVMTSDEWIEDLRAAGYFHPSILQEEDGKEVLTPVWEADPDGAEIISIFERRRMPTGKLVETVKYIECGLYAYIEVSSENETTREACNEKMMEEILRNWTGEKR